MLEASAGPVQRVAHIYYNLTSGERVVTLLSDGQTVGADTGSSSPVWSALIQNACADAGYTTEYFFGVDDAHGYTSLSSGITLLDYGDIEKDTVVDCVQVNWVAAHPDTDDDSDGIGDGVEELAGQWIVWDADNGRAVNQCVRSPLVDFLFFNLPGNVAEPGFLSSYTMDVDLVAFGTATNLSFEIGDSDGDCQSAAFCNLNISNQDNDFDSLPDSDLDGDGLFDWSWTVRFYQPGSGNDFDSDMDTGTLPPFESGVIGVSFGFPEGDAIDNGDGTWTWAIDAAPHDAGTGAEDRFAIYGPPDSNGNVLYAGGFFFGGFACEGGLVSKGGTGYAPPAMFQFQLFGPNADVKCNPANLNCDADLDFFDVSSFIFDYQAGGNFNGDGVTDFFDVSSFLQAFNAGCPLEETSFIDLRIAHRYLLGFEDAR